MVQRDAEDLRRHRGVGPSPYNVCRSTDWIFITGALPEAHRSNAPTHVADAFTGQRYNGLLFIAHQDNHYGALVVLQGERHVLVYDSMPGHTCWDEAPFRLRQRVGRSTPNYC